jgi:hypothetical protein
MTRVKLRKKNLLVDDKPIYLRSGTVQYWGIPKAHWGKILDGMVGIGLNAVEAYIPWSWHEPEEGHIDLSGGTCPERDIDQFIQAAANSGLFFIARPGPFINSEVRYGGHPLWLFDNYPEIVSHRADGGKAFWVGQGDPVPGQLHPVFLRLADRWYDAVIELLVGHSINNGGNVILFQPDNEMNLAFSYGFDGSLYDDHVMGAEGEPGLWQEWLINEHGDLETLAERFEKPFAKLADVLPPREKGTSVGELRLALDWLRFKQWYVFTYAQHLVKKAQDVGLDIPFFVNEPINKSWVWGAGEHGNAACFWLQQQEECFTTGHTYLYGGEMDVLGLSGVIGRIEMLKASALNGPVMSIEAGAGWFTFGDKWRADYNWPLTMKSQLGHGLDAYNIYSYASRVNPPQLGKTGGDYHWNAPVSELGQPREPYYLLQDFTGFVAGWEAEILKTSKSYDVAVGVFADLALLARPFRDYVTGGEDAGRNILKGKRSPAERLASTVYDSLEELVKALTDHNVSFRFVSLDCPNVAPDGKLPLIIPNPKILSAAGFDFVKEHIGNGGTVIFYPCIPEMDSDFNVRNDFLELLEAFTKYEIPEAGWSWGSIRYNLVDGLSTKDVPIPDRVFTFDCKAPGQVLVKHRDEIVAFSKEVSKGKVLALGVMPPYLNPLTQEFVQEVLLDASSVTKTARSQDGILNVVVRTGNNSQEPTLVVVGNYKGRASRTKLEVKCHDAELVFPKLIDLEVFPKSAWCLWCNLPLPTATLVYTTGELTPLNEAKTEFLVQGDMCTLGEVAFDRRVTVLIDGKPQESIEHEGLWITTFEHKRGGSRITIR